MEAPIEIKKKNKKELAKNAGSRNRTRIFAYKPGVLNFFKSVFLDGGHIASLEGVIRFWKEPRLESDEVGNRWKLRNDFFGTE